MSRFYLLYGHRIPFSLQDILHAVVFLIFIVEFQIIHKIFRCSPVLNILENHIPVRRFPLILIDPDKLREILPASGRGELPAVHCVLDPAEVLPAHLQIRDDRRMDLLPVCILLPHGKIRFHIDLLKSVQSHYVKISDRLVVLRRISRRHDDPALRELLIAEGLCLEKLQHGRRQRLGHTVDLIDKQHSFRDAGLLHLLVNRGDDLTHRILCHRIYPAAVFFFSDKRKPHSALPCMVRDCICHKADAHLLRNLLHDLCLADPRRSHQKHGALTDRRDPVAPESILCKICLYGILDLLFCTFYIQISFSSDVIISA